MPVLDKPLSASRRRFLSDAARTAGACAVAGSALAYLARDARALPAEAIRPPGALGEDNFLSACIRCGLCARDCPYDTLKLAELGEDGPATGTPYFTARDIPCEMCDDIPCVAACPTGRSKNRSTGSTTPRWASRSWSIRRTA